MKGKTAIVFAFALVLLLGSCGTQESTESPAGDRASAICIDGELYYGTGEPVPVEPEERAIQHSASYAENGVPTKNGETNFDRESGTPYAVLEDGMVVVLLDNEWIQFKSK